MAKLNTNITIELVWLKEKTELLKCSACGEVIYGDMNLLLLAPKIENIRLKGTIVNLVFCDSCKDLVEINK